MAELRTADILETRLIYRVLAMRSIGHSHIMAMLEEASSAMRGKQGFLHIEGKFFVLIPAHTTATKTAAGPSSVLQLKYARTKPGRVCGRTC